MLDIIVWAVIVLVISLGALLPRTRKSRHITPPQLVQKSPATLEQAARNREKVDDYFLQIREELHTLRQRLDQADLDSPDVEDNFNVIPIESAEKARLAKVAISKRRG